MICSDLLDAASSNSTNIHLLAGGGGVGNIEICNIGMI